VGGFRKTVRGRTKIEVYLQLRQLIQEEGDTWVIHPQNKKEAKKAMEYDQCKQEWVLEVRFEK